METYHSDVIGVSFGSYRRRTNGKSWIRTTETSWWRTTETSLGVSFETYLRRCRDGLMGRRHYVPSRRRHYIPIRSREDVPLRCRWVFHLRHTCDVAGTYKQTSLRRRDDFFLRGELMRIKNNSSVGYTWSRYTLVYARTAWYSQWLSISTRKN